MTDCLTRIRRDLTRLPADQVVIELELLSLSRTTGGNRTGDPATGPLPGGTQLLSLAAEMAAGGRILATLATWEDDWRSLRDMPPRTRPGTLADVCGWLHTHAPWAVESHPAVDDFATELADCARAVHRAIDGTDRWARTRLACWNAAPWDENGTHGDEHRPSGTHRPDRTPSDPQAACGAPLWIDRLDPASPLLVCRTCQATWTPEGLGDLRETPIAVHDAAALTGLSERILRHAIHRGRIPAVRVEHRVRIRLADVWRWRLSA